MVFGFSEIVTAHRQPLEESAHEQFLYLITGSLDARVDDDQEEVYPGGIIHIPMGARYGFSINGNNGVRFVTVSSTSKLESALA